MKYRISQRDTEPIEVGRDASSWQWTIEHKRPSYQATTPRNQNPLILKRLQHEYSVNLLERQQELHQKLTDRQIVND